MKLFNEDFTCSSVAAKLKIPIALVDFMSQTLKTKWYNITPICLSKGNFLKK